MKTKQLTKEEKFEMVIDNEYNIDLMLDIIFPMITAFAGIGFGLGIFYKLIPLIFMSGFLLFLSLLIYFIGLLVYLEGRKVYWRKVK